MPRVLDRLSRFVAATVVVADCSSSSGSDVVNCVDIDDLRRSGASVELEDGVETSRVLDVESGNLRAGNFYELGGR